MASNKDSSRSSEDQDLGTGSQASKEAVDLLIRATPDPKQTVQQLVTVMQAKAENIRQTATNGERARLGKVASSYARWASFGRAWLRNNGVQVAEPPTPADDIRNELEAPGAIEPDVLGPEVNDILCHGIDDGIEDTMGLDTASDMDMNNAAFRTHMVTVGESLLAELVATKDLKQLFRAPLVSTLRGFKTTVIFFSTVTLVLKNTKIAVRNVVVNGKTLKAKHPNILQMPSGQGFIRSTKIIEGRDERWVKAVVAEEGMVWRIFVTVENRRSDPNTEYGTFRNGKVVQITEAEYRAIEDKLS